MTRIIAVATVGASFLLPLTQFAAAQGLAPYVVEGGAIVEPLHGERGNADKGASLVADRQKSLCTLCHAGPFPDAHLHGDLAPDLSGVGARLSEGEIRLRIVDMQVLNPSTIMPSYYKVGPHPRILAAWSGKPLLGASEIEDLVAFLVTLKE